MAAQYAKEEEIINQQWNEFIAAIIKAVMDESNRLIRDGLTKERRPCITIVNTTVGIQYGFICSSMEHSHAKKMEKCRLSYDVNWLRCEVQKCLQTDTRKYSWVICQA